MLAWAPKPLRRYVGNAFGLSFLTPRTSAIRRTCYAIVDGTWSAVPVEKGQAPADSARQVGARPLAPVPELTTEWLVDR